MDKRKLEERKARKAMEQLAALMQQVGVQSPEVEKIDIKKAARDSVTRKYDPSLEAEAVLSYIRKPDTFIVKQCKREECGEPFSTNYRSVGYCSDNCRAKDLAKIGIQWNPHKVPEERWGGEPPLIIPPEAIEAMAKLLRKSHKGRHQEAVDESQIQTESVGENVEQEQMQKPEPEDGPLYHEVYQDTVANAAADIPPVLEEVSQPEPGQQSPVNPEYIHPEDDQTQEDIPETTIPDSQPQLETVPAKTEAKSVFDF